MLEFFNTVYGQIVIVVGALTTLWSLAKIIGALRKWIASTTYWKKYVARKEAPVKALNLIEEVRAHQNEQDARIAEMQLSVVALQKDIYMNNESTAAMMLEKMMWSYDYYVINQNPIPLVVQTALCVIFDQYKLCDWHNHVPEDFKERIRACKVLG